MSNTSAGVYGRVSIFDEAKFLTVTMASFRNNTKELYGIFQHVLTTIKPPQNQRHYHRIVTQ